MFPAILATGLRKAFGQHVVLDGVDLHIPDGTIYALLGPNGAGKPLAWCGRARHPTSCRR